MAENVCRQIFEDEIAAAGLLQQPDRGVGVHLDDRSRIRISANVR